MNGKIETRKAIVRVKPTCSDCRKTRETLSQLSFKQGLLGFVDIEMQHRIIYNTSQALEWLLRSPLVECIDGCNDLVAFQQNGELLKQLGTLRRIGTLQ